MTYLGMKHLPDFMLLYNFMKTEFETECNWLDHYGSHLLNYDQEQFEKNQREW